jgi:hypothetical protein
MNSQTEGKRASRLRPPADGAVLGVHAFRQILAIHRGPLQLHLFLIGGRIQLDAKSGFAFTVP